MSDGSLHKSLLTDYCTLCGSKLPPQSPPPYNKPSRTGLELSAPNIPTLIILIPLLLGHFKWSGAICHLGYLANGGVSFLFLFMGVVVLGFPNKTNFTIVRLLELVRGICLDDALGSRNMPRFRFRLSTGLATSLPDHE